MRLMLFAVLLAFAAPSVASATPDAPTARQCFATTEWRGWSAPGNGDVLYIGVGLHDVYRVQLTPGTHVRKDPDRFLINQVRGSNWICSPLDLDLTLSDRNGFVEPLIVQELHKLTPAETAAIPIADRP